MMRVQCVTLAVYTQRIYSAQRKVILSSQFIPECNQAFTSPLLSLFQSDGLILTIFVLQ